LGRFGRIASCIGDPSGASKGNFTRRAIVGAMSGEVTGVSLLPLAGTNPGPYQSIGTFCV
jgi:hypothetical protein